MLSGRAMFIWDLSASLNGGTTAAMVVQAQRAKLSSLWVKIADGATAYANTVGATGTDLKSLVAGCQAANISVLGYHVPHCATLADVGAEVTLVANIVRDFNLAGVVIDNEDGASYFRGDSACASAYGQQLQTAMRSVSKLMVMASNDIVSYHPKAYAAVIGAFVDVNAPQVYYGASPSVQSRLNWAISENQSIAAPFFPTGAAFVSKPGAGDGGFTDPKLCGQWAGDFINLVSKLNQSNPAKYPGYSFWDWQEAPQEFWETLYTTPVFTAPAPGMAVLAALAVKVPSSKPSLSGILDVFDKRSQCIAITGVIAPDLNLPDNTLIVVDESDYYSIPTADIVDKEQQGDLTRIWVKKGTRAWRSNAIAVGGSFPMRETAIGMEDLPEPPTVDVPGGPTKATAAHQQRLSAPGMPAQTIAAAAAAYSGSCVGGDHYVNNCAHFLSDAFIRAGFTELSAGQSADHFITARCGTPAKRPIRARDMWQWFQSKATQTTRSIDRNTGVWAVFQLDEQVYWGGHVLIIDTDAGAWYGTGNHSTWQQYGYKW